MDLIIRELYKSEYYILKEILYEAIFIPKGIDSPSKEILNKPELQIYISNFGKKDDNALVALVNNKIVGIVWTRIMNDYGYVDDNTPSLSISLYKEFRGLGIGYKLMKEMLELLKEKGYKQVSLSVQKENYAVNLYKKLGFEIYKVKDLEYIMLYKIKQ